MDDNQINLALADFKRQAKNLLFTYGYNKSDIRIYYDFRGSAVFVELKTKSEKMKELTNELKKLAGCGSASDVQRDYFEKWTNIVDKDGMSITYLFVSSKVND